MKNITCVVCGKKFLRTCSLKRHMQYAHNESGNVQCPKCNKKFTRNDALSRHVKNAHPIANNKELACAENVSSSGNEQSTSNKRQSDCEIAERASKKRRCEACKIEVLTSEWPRHIRRNSHKSKSLVDVPMTRFMKIRQCFEGKVETFMLENKREDLLNIKIFLNECKSDVLNLIQDSFKRKGSAKFSIELFAEFVKHLTLPDGEEDAEITIKSFKSAMQIALESRDLSEIFSSITKSIDAKSEEFNTMNSGWSLVCIKHIEVNINQYKPLRGSSYIKLPKCIQAKKACINIQNNDDYCFKWSIISALCPAKKNAQRTHSYRVGNISDDIINLPNGRKLNFSDLVFPLKLKDISLFETLNPNISVSVFGIEKKSNDSYYKVVGPYYLPMAVKPIHINILMIEKGSNNHFVWIKNMHRLISTQANRGKRSTKICNSCLLTFNTNKAFIKHQTECNRTVTTLPNEHNKVLKFEHHSRSLQVPFVIYADFECMLVNTQNEDEGSSRSSTTPIKKHVPIAVSYYLKCSFDPKLDKLFKYTGTDCPQVFVRELIEESKRIYREYLSVNTSIKMTTQNIDDFNKEEHCHICSRRLEMDKVRDHCHLTGSFRGAAHQKCNLNYKVPNFLPIFFHNLTAYDAHLFIKELGNTNGDINIIPLNKEKYISISKSVEVNSDDGKKYIELRFLDSFRFLPSSLDNISKTLTKNDFSILSRFYKDDEKSFELMTRKGVFCYDYIDSLEKLTETKLPPIAAFRNSLLEIDCSPTDYERAENIWNNFKCSSLGQYLEIYLTSDVLILADIFEKFRNDSRGIYGLDPCHYFTLPGFSWSAMLKKTNIKLELLTDINMYNFFSRGIRGGLTQCTLRHCKANNKYMEEYDATKPSQYLMYLDANNLYGWAMSEYLPCSGFQWIDPPTDLSSIKEWLLSDKNVGYVLEVDLEYPQNIHDEHNDLPFCPSNESLSKTSQNKLIASLKNKLNYTIHYQTLIQCIENGLILKKIHRIIKFQQSPWLKEYIDLNNELRKKATTKFEKDLRKLCNNAVFGKTMENVDKRKDVRIVISAENSSNGRQLGARALIAKPNFHSILEFNENMAAVQMNRIHTLYNKPIYLGFCVLEISKYKMYDFHYTYMKPKFAENLQLAYMDTDSFIYQINTDDFYADIKDDIKDKFDTSDYSPTNPFGIAQLNVKKLGYMKDENNGKIMVEFIGLRAKMYCIDVQDSEVIKKAKGVKAAAVRKLTLSKYRDCLLQRTDYYCTMLNFRSKQHTIYTEMINKKSLSCDDDKRFIDENNVSTLAWGHYKIDDKAGTCK